MNSSRKVKIVIDTNVFVSGLLFGGIPKKVLNLWSRDKVIMCVSADLKAEIFNKLKNKFQVSTVFLSTFDIVFESKSDKYLPKKKIDLLKDKKDNFLLELAYEAKAEFLVTGDKELLTLKRFESTEIISPKQFLEKI